MPQNETFLFLFFTLFVLALLALDLGVFHRRPHAVGMREAAIWSAVWVMLSLLFTAGVFVAAGPGPGLEFLTGYLIEKALSVDNIFVFIMIFSYFKVPREYQHTVLFWGVLGALVLRGVFIGLGTALITRMEWVLYIFGAILVFSGWKMLAGKEVEVDPERNIVIRLVRRLFPVSPGYSGRKFLVRQGGRLMATPLFIVLLTVETTDLVFAVDSIPAVFGVTRDPFIVYSSNVFAILGLRALYFLLAGAMVSFHYLSRGLSAVLIFIGLKMLVADFVHVPTAVSLLVVSTVLGGSIVASVIRNRRRGD